MRYPMYDKLARYWLLYVYLHLVHNLSLIQLVVADVIEDFTNNILLFPYQKFLSSKSNDNNMTSFLYLSFSILFNLHLISKINKNTTQ